MQCFWWEGGARTANDIIRVGTLKLSTLRRVCAACCQLHFVIFAGVVTDCSCSLGSGQPDLIYYGQLIRLARQQSHLVSWHYAKICSI